MRNILARYLKDDRNGFMVFSIIILLMALYVTWIFPSITKFKQINELMENMPPFLKAFFGSEFSQSLDFTSFKGFMTIEFFNTTWLIVGGVFATLFGANMIAPEVERKTAELLLAQPVSRESVYLGRVVGYVIFLLGLVAVTHVGMMLGAPLARTDVSSNVFFPVYVNGFFLFLALGLFSSLISVLVDDQKRALVFSLGFFFLLYFFNLFGTLSERVHSLRYISIFAYYDASRNLNRGTVDWNNVGILLAFGLVMAFLALWKFRGKDILI